MSEGGSDQVHGVVQELILDADDPSAGLIAALGFDQVHELLGRVDVGLLEGSTDDDPKGSVVAGAELGAAAGDELEF